MNARLFSHIDNKRAGAESLSASNSEHEYRNSKQIQRIQKKKTYEKQAVSNF
jgi:hypothetical protein